MKIDTALYNNEKRHQLEGYFIIDTILSLSHPGTLHSWFLNPGMVNAGILPIFPKSIRRT